MMASFLGSSRLESLGVLDVISTYASCRCCRGMHGDMQDILFTLFGTLFITNEAIICKSEGNTQPLEIVLGSLDR